MPRSERKQHTTCRNRKVRNTRRRRRRRRIIRTNNVEYHLDDFLDLSSLQDDTFSEWVYPDLIQDMLLVEAREYAVCLRDHFLYGHENPAQTFTGDLGIMGPPSGTTTPFAAPAAPPTGRRRLMFVDCDGCATRGAKDYTSNSRFPGKCLYTEVVQRAGAHVQDAECTKDVCNRHTLSVR